VLGIERVRANARRYCRVVDHVGDVAVLAVPAAYLVGRSDEPRPHRRCRALLDRLPCEGGSGGGLGFNQLPCGVGQYRARVNRRGANITRPVAPVELDSERTVAVLERR